MTVVRDAIAAQLLTLERVVPTPSGELGYGTDLAGVLDSDDQLSEVDPTSNVAIGEALLRRLLTRRGWLVDAPNYGTDIRGYCNRGVPQNELVDLAGEVRAELSKDDRVQSLTVNVSQPTTSVLNVAALVVPAVLGLAPFQLVFAVTSGAATMELIGG